MSEQDAAIMVLVISAVVGLVGLMLGIVAADGAWRNWCVQKGIARYNPRTGRWEFEEKWRDEQR